MGEKKLRTKWEILQEKLEKVKAEVQKQEQYLQDLEVMPWGHPCGTCQKILNTEADFAKHYSVPDERYYNLGHCPTKDGWSDGTR